MMCEAPFCNATEATEQTWQMYAIHLPDPHDTSARCGRYISEKCRPLLRDMRSTSPRCAQYFRQVYAVASKAAKMAAYVSRIGAEECKVFDLGILRKLGYEGENVRICRG